MSKFWELFVNTATNSPCVALINPVAKKVISNSWSAKEKQLEALLPGAELLLKNTGINWQDLTAVTAVSGPGSFTALRIGISFTNTLVQELGLDYYQIDTGAFLNCYQPDAAVLLKAGGYQVHHYQPKTRNYEQILLKDFLPLPKIPYIVDFSEKIAEKWDYPEVKLVKTEALPELNWDNWQKITEYRQPSQWPLEPNYQKEPAITLPGLVNSK